MQIQIGSSAFRKNHILAADSPMEAKNRLHQSIARVLTATFQDSKLEFVRKPIMKAASLAMKLVALCSDESAPIDMNAVKTIETEFERCRNFLSSIAKHYEKDFPASRQKCFLKANFFILVIIFIFLVATFESL